MLSNLFEKNRTWAARIARNDPEFFPALSRQQSPQYLWIGCADSRVPANEIVGLMPGELFVQRNVANLVVHTDFNCLSVIQFAVDILKVRHIMVVGHYGCSGVQTALRNNRVGLADNWLRHVRDVHQKHESLVRAAPDAAAEADRLCELNVIEQVLNLCYTTIAQDAWTRNQELAVHGWIYGLQDGLLRDLRMTVAHPDHIESVYQRSIEAVRSGETREAV